MAPLAPRGYAYDEITWRAAEGLNLANFILYLFVLRLSENTYKVLYLD